MMSFRTALLVVALTALVVSTVGRAASWSNDTSYTVGMAAFVVVLLICFRFMDPETMVRGRGRH